MCKYCYFKENGDSGDEWGIIGDGVANIPMEYVIEEKTRKKEMTISDTIPVYLQLCVYKTKGEYALNVSAEVKGNETADDGYAPDEVNFPIKFCPMCGKKLKG